MGAAKEGLGLVAAAGGNEGRAMGGDGRRKGAGPRTGGLNKAGAMGEA